MMNFNLYIFNNNFLITNKELKSDFLIKIVDNYNFLFGYCFSNNRYVRNQHLSDYDLNFISDNYFDISGIFCLIKFDTKQLKIYLDPLFQFPLFYTIDHYIYISNNIFLINKYSGKSDPNINFLFDNLSYSSPMRGLTIINDIYMMRKEDIELNSEILKSIYNSNLKIICDYKLDYNISYSELCHVYIERLLKKANILKNQFEQIHLTLTGGCDSRLVLASFLDYDNLFCYCYGNGTSQDRLFCNYLTNVTNKKIPDKLLFRGDPLNSPAKIVKGLYDSNFYKLNLLNGYLNTDEHIFPNYCDVTGYYGANISGAVALPSDFQNIQQRLQFIPNQYFTYFSYLHDFIKRNNKLRPASLLDKFYINNRGKSHYATQSIVQCRVSNHCDILYDPLNLLLVIKSPYKDEYINKCAISIDLISILNHHLAYLPYNNRRIPEYKLIDSNNYFKHFNCFDGFKFTENRSIFEIGSYNFNTDYHHFIFLMICMVSIHIQNF